MYHIEMSQLSFSLTCLYPPLWQYGTVAETDKEWPAKTSSKKGVEGGMADMVRRWSLQLPRPRVLSLNMKCEQKETEKYWTVLFFSLLGGL